MAISALAVGTNLRHEYIDNAFLDTIDINNLPQYDYFIVDPTSIGELLSSPDSIQEVASLFVKLRQSIYKYINDGGKVVCFLRPQQVQDGNTNYDWLLTLEPGNRRAFIQPLYNQKCLSRNEAGIWNSYLSYSKIETYVHWLGNYQGTEILAVSGSNKYVAVKLTIGLGHILFLPPIQDKSHAQIFVHNLRLESQEPSEEKATITPLWIKQYELAKENEYKEEIKSLDIKIKDLSLERDTKIQYMLYLSSLGDLLWGTGIQVLETAVQRAFQELGFLIERQGEIDLVIKGELGRGFVEIEGTEKMVRVHKGEQLMRYILNHRVNSDETIKGVIVGNAFRLEDPNNRPPLKNQFSDQLQGLARANNVALISTVSLYRLVDDVLMNRRRSIDVRRLIFNTNGLLDI